MYRDIESASHLQSLAGGSCHLEELEHYVHRVTRPSGYYHQDYQILGALPSGILDPRSIGVKGARGGYNWSRLNLHRTHGRGCDG